MKTLPTFEYEQQVWSTGSTLVAGLDEVGRGAFAGPVVVAAVIFAPHYKFFNSLLYEINDSKKLSSRKRTILAKSIKEEALCFAIQEGSLDIINRVGIGKATQQAFLEVTKQLCHTPDFFLIDAFYIDRLDKAQQKPIIHGDSLSISIAAASIIAKVYRDELMDTLHMDYSNYFFNQNKGYGTSLHREKIKEFGLSPLHRTSFSLEKFLPQG
jgi:ribonuclease HII